MNFKNLKSVLVLLTTLIFYSNIQAQKVPLEGADSIEWAIKVLSTDAVHLRFGSGCGWAGTPPIGQEAIDILRSNKSISKITDILNGENYVGKLYAIEALLILGRDGHMVLSKGLKNKIKYIIQQDRKFSHCRGCVVQRNSTKSLFRERYYRQLLRANKLKI